MQNDTEGIRTPAGRAQWISSPSPWPLGHSVTRQSNHPQIGDHRRLQILSLQNTQMFPRRCGEDCLPTSDPKENFCCVSLHTAKWWSRRERLLGGPEENVCLVSLSHSRQIPLNDGPEENVCLVSLSRNRQIPLNGGPEKNVCLVSLSHSRQTAK